MNQSGFIKVNALSRRAIRVMGMASLALLPALSTLRAGAQQAGADSLQARLERERSSLLEEKLFAHTDKSFYLTGELLWCSLYCVDGATHRPLDVSKVAYLELLDREDRAVLQGKVALARGVGQGSFHLPATLNSGVYKLRAYTNWMKNTGPSAFFEMPLTIVNTFKPLPLPDSVAIRRAAYRLGLYPEGGNLVAGIRSKLGFRLANGAGQGVDGKGWVLNEKGDTVASFGTGRFGLGHFEFLPGQGHVYHAVAILPDGGMLTREMPAVFETGYVLQVVEEDGGTALTVKAMTSPGLAVKAGGWAYLVIRAAGGKDQVRTIVFNGDAGSVKINKAELAEGINRLTLVDAGGKPVCERLYGLRPKHLLQLDLVADQNIYLPRHPVTLTLKEGAGQELAPASLSMSVYRVDPLQPVGAGNLAAWLWFGSELKGRVESPEYYLSGVGATADADLDDLMLTHGWRGLHWTARQFGYEHPLYPPEHRGQLISGRLLDPKTGKPAGGIPLFVSVPGVQFQFAAARTDSAGRFVSDIKDFYGAGNLLVQTNTSAQELYKIELSSPFSEQYGGDSLDAFELSDTLADLLAARSLGMQVQNLYLADTLEKFSAPATDSLRFFGKPDHTYKLDDYTRFTTMEEVLREYVREINVNHLHGHLHVLMLDEPVKDFFDDNNTLVLLDGIPVVDDKIFFYDPLKVNKLEIISRSYIVGPSVFSGVASFTTYKGDYDSVRLDPRSLMFDYEGLQPQRAFYQPAYEHAKDIGSRIPDYREVLSWQPEIRLETGQEEKRVRFTTSDLQGKYVVVVQGLTADGRAVTQYLSFEVRQ